MLYKFKSKISSDLIMLEPHGRRMLQIMGKTPGAPGIVLPEQMSVAIAALKAAVIEEEEYRKHAIEQAQAMGEPTPHFDAIGLRQRSLPMIELFSRCLKANVELVWGL